MTAETTKRTVNLKLDEPLFRRLGATAAALDTSKQELIESYIRRCLPDDEQRAKERLAP
jgi:hypothetical protein